LLLVGIWRRPDLELNHDYAVAASNGGWFINSRNMILYGNGKNHTTSTRFRSSTSNGGYMIGDRGGVMLDLDKGSLLFFKNGLKHGQGYPARTVTGPVMHAASLDAYGSSPVNGSCDATR
jgi:hypothetical protein